MDEDDAASRDSDALERRGALLLLLLALPGERGCKRIVCWAGLPLVRGEKTYASGSAVLGGDGGCGPLDAGVVVRELRSRL